MDGAFALPDDAPYTDTDTLATEEAQEEQRRADETSREFLCSWNRLVSTTNWEKGRIINQWRDALIDAGSLPSSYCDEAWSRRVGGVTPQHVGRLRRVHQRFHDTFEQYDGLYWSHFQAVLDWDDAEMWLEGAVQNGWSVARMREQRWEAQGAVTDQKPRDEDVIAAELDEDVRPEDDGDVTISDVPTAVRPTAEAASPDPDDIEANRELQAAAATNAMTLDAPAMGEAVELEPIRPFENLPELPDDLADAVEAFKLAIVQHKLAGWRDVRCDDVLAVLSALKQLALAPTEG